MGRDTPSSIHSTINHRAAAAAAAGALLYGVGLLQEHAEVHTTARSVHNFWTTQTPPLVVSLPHNRFVPWRCRDKTLIDDRFI